MRPPAGPPVAGAVYFGDQKCCTWWPQLHSFLVGRILRDPAPELAPARAELERQVAAGCGCTPLGLFGPGWFWTLYHGSSGAFGRAARLRCPFFDAAGGGCGVWRHREATCATWFCKLHRGAVGLALWEALRRVLVHLERSLAVRCALEVGLEEEALGASLAELGSRTADAADLEGGMAPALRARLWGRWAGRERELFGRCAEVAGALSPAEVLALGGAEGAALAALARRRLAAAQDEALPAAPLVPGRRERLPSAGELARVVTYRRYDPLELPAALLRALDRFDGRATAAVVAEIGAREGLDVTPALLRLLLDFEVLVPAAPGAGAAAP